MRDETKAGSECSAGLGQIEILRKEAEEWARTNGPSGLLGLFPNRSCWHCNPAHEWMKHDMTTPYDCFECGHIYFKGVRLTEEAQRMKLTGPAAVLAKPSNFRTQAGSGLSGGLDRDHQASKTSGIRGLQHEPHCPTFRIWPFIHDHLWRVPGHLQEAYPRDRSTRHPVPALRGSQCAAANGLTSELARRGASDAERLGWAANP